MYRPDITVRVPQLPPFPSEAACCLSDLIRRYRNDYRIGLVGSSLGGYFSIWLNARFQCRAVLINPAIRPDELLLYHLGEQENPYTQERYLLEPHHIEELQALNVEAVTTLEQFWLLLQTGDEVLDYRQAVEKLKGVRQVVETGGDHSFVGFERYAADIVRFLRL
jgi:predicted esterase YcpF (UPF0227 family)